MFGWSDHCLSCAVMCVAHEMVSVVSQLVEEVTAHAQSDSLEDA